MTEHQTAAERARERTLAKGRERAAAYYAKHHDEVLERRRSRYAHDTAHREAVKRYQRERYATMKQAVETLRKQRNTTTTTTTGD